MFLQTVSILFLSAVLFGCLEGKGVQMQRDVQCCMQYSQGKVRTKDVLSLYTKKAVKCADPRDRKVKRLLRKLNQRTAAKAHRTMWPHRHMNLPVMSEVDVVNSQKMNKLCIVSITYTSSSIESSKLV
ncbi:chemokine (C-C motif) ligand 44 [Chanodichthys erythropterus]|uniref:chemokine (C-C motif) ligand 44 n=1 Tax=Chanodichthys erythropterus TaxID=933992 RepID=UPI00351F29D9